MIRLLLAMAVVCNVLFAALVVANESLDISSLGNEIFLGDVGTRRVGWQSYNQEPVAMPSGWDGSDSVSGVVHEEQGWIFGRRVLLVHPPWRVATGKVWSDYPLTLPQSDSIKLSFGIALRPDGVGKSDGTTFSCYLTVDGRRQELMREHYALADWKDYQFDLTPYAGKQVSLRLQAEPGPSNDSSFDASFFGDAKILAVTDVGVDRSNIVKRMTNSRAYQATKPISLTRLSNQSKNGVTPSSLLPCLNRVESFGGGVRFIYQAKDCRIVYAYKPTTGTLDDFTVQVDEGPAFKPAFGGGITVSFKDQGKTRELFLREGRLVKKSHKKNSLEVLWEYPVGDQKLRIAWKFGIIGKALTVSAQCVKPEISRLSLGQLGPVPLWRYIPVPYLSGKVVYLPTQHLFVNRCIDWTRSHASRCPQGEAIYETKTNGRRNPLVESGYIAVSPNIGEVLPNIPAPPSPFLATLAPKIVLDIWEHHQGTYQGDAENLLTLKDHGVDHVAVIQHKWQRYGYDIKLPDHMPANPAYGGDVGMIAFGKAANQCGYLWSLHENYIDLYKNAPSFDATAQVLKEDGSPSEAWYNSATKEQSFGLKCNRALEFAQKNSPEAHRRYGTSAAYLDIHTSVPPWHQLDHEAGQPMAAMALARFKQDTKLFRFMRQVHDGPLLGEGHWHFYWAGLADGVEAEVTGGEDHAPLLDFDLLKIHPQMVNHGMGYYERWFRRGYGSRWGHDVGTVEQIDKYRAQELAYGHAGFVGGLHVDNLFWVVREHHLVHSVQRLYGTSQPVEIRYEVDGQWVDAGIALAVGRTTRQRICYDSGLTLWVNWESSPWQIEGRALPQWGFLALGPDTEVWTALRNGHWADYAECPEYLFADARTSFPMPYLSKDVEPRLQSFKSLGDKPLDFSARLNKPGTLINFGPLATDGAVKIQREPDRLVVFPYPRNKTFQVQLDLEKLAPTANPEKIQVRALAANTLHDLGPVNSLLENKTLMFHVGKHNAGRFIVEWK